MSRPYIGTDKNFFDKKTREDIARVVEAHMVKINKEDVEILNVGSPYLWELYDLKVSTKNKVNVVAVDLEADQEDYNTSGVDFKSTKSIKDNFFNYEPDRKFDIIVNRWFLHHLTAEQTKSFFYYCKEDLLAPNGIIISVDYFFKKFNKFIFILFIFIYEINFFKIASI